MKLLNGMLAGLFALGLVALAGCDGGSIKSPQTGSVGPRQSTAPRLDSLEPRNICVGQEVILEGVNFSHTLEENRVTFAGVPGLPVRIEFPSNGNPADGLESRLRVVVPTGVLDGNVELKVAGVTAGLRDYTACPQIVSFGIGPTGNEPRLTHSGLLGFFPQNPPITFILFGLNFESVTNVTVIDRLQNTAVIPRARFISRQIPNMPQNKLQTIEVTLENVNVQPPPPQGVASQRENLTVKVNTDQFTSNEVQIPMGHFQANPAAGIGAVINGILLPPGVRTGPVRLHYSMYDHPVVDQSFVLQVQWTVDGGKSFFDAVPDISDLRSDGTRQVFPGDIDFESQAGLLFSGGALRTYTWDGQNDDKFRELISTLPGAPRSFTIQFRLHPLPEAAVVGKPGDTGHFLLSPPLAYYDLEDRSGTSLALQRRGEVVETFRTTQNVDSACNSGRWGPPQNPGELRGSVPTAPEPQVGAGTFNLEMTAIQPPPDGLTAEAYLINTDTMTVIHLIDVGGDVTALQVFPTIDDPNPGELDAEFHLGSLLLEEGMRLFLDGSRPAIFRVSGVTPQGPLDDLDLSVRIEGIVDANGEPGGPPDPNAPGVGGPGFAGGGRGGNGAGIAPDQTGGSVGLLVHAERGENDGGEGGLTTCALAPSPDTASKVTGGPGGGGGHRLAGGDGEAAVARAGQIPFPRGGFGGPRRGSAHQNPLTGGSGGGGGGATLDRPQGTPVPIIGVPRHGAGGGGGGGAIQITSRGSMAISGQILANGGKGGDGNSSGAGGGGSGGSILLQSTGFIDVACGSLQVLGGENGASTGQNTRAGSGEGAPGWVRVESRVGGGPFCSPLAAQTELSARLDTGTLPSKVINVNSVLGFPPRGVVLIDSEVIAYNKVGAGNNTLQELSRGLRGTQVANHEVPARVILEAPVSPPDGLVMTSGDINVTADPIVSGAGPDGAFHVFFVETPDPETGELLVDPVTGERISLWTLDTDAGAILNPTGSVALVASAARTDPGLFSFTRFKIDRNVILRAQGSRPLRILVTEVAEVAGTLDLSGGDGGPLRFDQSSPGSPEPGESGLSGPGGGVGGKGAGFAFEDGNPLNKDLANVRVIAAEHGGLPATFPPEFDRTGATSGSVPPPDDLAELETTRATPGDSLRQDPVACGSIILPCTAGGGGGGGSRLAGSNGESRPPGSAAFGRGASPIGLDGFRYGGELALWGGHAGAGGGGSNYVSDDYRNGRAGNSVFKSAARYAPGTGGGGGGGALHLVVQGAFILRGTGAILARGGNAFQSIDQGGNGGAGAGGSVLIQLANSLSIDAGARIEVSGGLANRPPPRASESGLPLYEGNIRLVGTETRVFGGLGGNGALGRVRFEAPIFSSLHRRGFNDSISSSVMLTDAALSVGCSATIPLGVGPGSMAASHLLFPESAALRFADQGLPDGTDAVLLWKGAPPSLDVLGEPGPLRGGIEDVGGLQDIEFIQFSVHITSNVVSRETPTIREVRLPYRLGNPDQ